MNEIAKSFDDELSFVPVAFRVARFSFPHLIFIFVLFELPGGSRVPWGRTIARGAGNVHFFRLRESGSSPVRRATHSSASVKVPNEAREKIPTTYTRVCPFGDFLFVLLG